MLEGLAAGRTNGGCFAKRTAYMEKLSWNTTASHHFPLSYSVLASRQLEHLAACRQDKASCEKILSVIRPSSCVRATSLGQSLTL